MPLCCLLAALMLFLSSTDELAPDFSAVRLGLPPRFYGLPRGQPLPSSLKAALISSPQLVLTSKEYMSTVTSVDPHWLAEEGNKFYSIREQNFSERDRRARDKAFVTESNNEMQLKEEFAKAQEEKEERLRAVKSVASTPRVIGVGTPFSKSRTPRRVGL